ncbi:hypothetical protein [Aquamicrobium soli]|uniref:Uncharacterized protein n=1 Tax=Aquamicrobium soli TaxID=1811518 RepID=A0ABV7KJ75_9HYPH
MNQSTGLRFDWAAAADLADIHLVVRARLIEAADTFQHIQLRGLSPSDRSGFWPEAALDYSEVSLRYRPSASAISRAEEVYHSWLPDLVTDDAHRYVLGQYAACMAGASTWGSFRNFCDKTQANRRTPQRWVDAEINGIAQYFCKSARSLHVPNWSRVSPMLRVSGIDLAKMSRPTFERADDAVPVHIDDPVLMRELAKAITKSNKRLQKQKARRKSA